MEQRFLARHVAPWTAWLPWSFGLLAPLALVGLAVTRGGGARCFPLWGFLVAYSASVVLFFVNARFRLPVLPAVEVYAAAALVWGFDAERARRWRPLAVAVPAVLALVALTKVPAEVIARSESNGWLILAQAHARAGELARAVELFERAVRAAPTSSIAWRDLALARRGAGDIAGAEEAYREALRLRPDDVVSLSGLADLLLAAGRTEAALDLERRAVAVAPQLAAAHYDLGRALLATQAPAQAAAAFRAALARDPRHFGAAYALGRVEREQGREAEALAALLQALAAPEPEDPRFLLDAQLGAIDLLARAGRRAEALELARAARARFPDDPRAQQAVDALERGP